MREVWKQKDMDQLLSRTCIPWEDLRERTVLVTGATGLIGTALVKSLLYANQEKDLHLQVLALVRDRDKAARRFGSDLESGSLRLLVGSVEEPIARAGAVDYIIHGASPTASAYFASNPVECIQTAVLGTRNLLELAREKKASGFLYLSSMEVYGAPESDEPIEETHGAEIDTMSPRSSYPEGKRLSETLCASYCGEYGVPAKVIRLAQTFGRGIDRADSRVFAQFARAALQRSDIILKTTGESKHCYLDIRDAVSAILTVLLSGKAGQAYNAANPATYCSILEMAHFVADTIAGGAIRVAVELDDRAKAYFPPTHHLKLNTEKLTKLGWSPSYSLRDMYVTMLDGMQEPQET